MTVLERASAGVGGFKSGRGMTYRRGPANRKPGKRACKDMASGCIYLSEKRNSVFRGERRLTVASVASSIFHPRLVCGIVEPWPPLRGEWGLPHLRAQNQHPYGAPEKLPSVPVLTPRLRPGVHTPTERNQLTK